MTGAVTPPSDLDAFFEQVRDRYEGLSDRLQRIARHVLDEPNDMAFETLAVIAERSNVQPSAIVRFAQSFGFPGASPMQRLIREGLLSQDRRKPTTNTVFAPSKSLIASASSRAPTA